MFCTQDYIHLTTTRSVTRRRATNGTHITSRLLYWARYHLPSTTTRSRAQATFWKRTSHPQRQPERRRRELEYPRQGPEHHHQLSRTTNKKRERHQQSLEHYRNKLECRHHLVQEVSSSTSILPFPPWTHLPGIAHHHLGETVGNSGNVLLILLLYLVIFSASSKPLAVIVNIVPLFVFGAAGTSTRFIFSWQVTDCSGSTNHSHFIIKTINTRYSSCSNHRLGTHPPHTSSSR